MIFACEWDFKLGDIVSHRCFPEVVGPIDELSIDRERTRWVALLRQNRDEEIKKEWYRQSDVWIPKHVGLRQ